MGTHTYDLIKIIRRVNPQNLDRDMTTLVFTLPDIGVPATIQRGTRSIVTKWDVQ